MVADATPYVSDSAFDSDTIFSIPQLEQIKQPPKKTADPETDCLVSLSEGGPTPFVEAGLEGGA